MFWNSYYHTSYQDTLKNNSYKIENGNEEYVKDTTCPKSRQQLKATNGSSMQLENVYKIIDKITSTNEIYTSTNVFV